jgi:hypothetical protein
LSKLIGTWARRPAAKNRDVGEHGGPARWRPKQVEEDKSRFERTRSKNPTGSRLMEAGEADQSAGEVDQHAEERKETVEEGSAHCLWVEEKNEERKNTQNKEQ